MGWRSSMVAAVLGALGCMASAQAAVPAKADSAPRLVYVGVRDGGPGKGITAARFDPVTGKLTGLGLAAEVERATWVMASPHRPVLYSVSAAGSPGSGQGAILSFTADPRTGKLSELSRVDSGGADPTHITIGNSPNLFVSNYGGGSVSVVPLQPGGTLSPVSSVQAATGSGPHPRQKSPHAHGALVDKSGRYVFVSDLGADRIFIYRFDPAKKSLTPHGAVEAKPGTGPRHLAMSADGRFLYNNLELSAEITTYRWDAAAGRLTPVRTMSVLPPDYTGTKSAGEIGLSPDGRFLYVTSRGEDVIITYAVDARTGGLTEIQRVPAGGKQPWAFALDPNGRWMLVANETSGELVVFRRDPVKGTLTATPEKLAVPRASSIALVVR